MNRKHVYPALLSALMIGSAVLAGCGKADTANPAGDKAGVNPDAYNNEPVTLTFYSHNASVLNDAELEALVTRAIKTKYPNITPKLITGTTPDKFIASGEIPDVILTSNYYFHDLLQWGLVSDLNSFVKNEKIDFGKFEPETINVMKSFSDKGEFLGIPYALSYGMMLYNKDIFDKFAVPYPKDGMTWNEVIELARKVTRADQGVQYIGLDLGNPTVITRQLGLPALDEKGEKAVLQTDGYKRVYSLYEKLYSIPGIVDKGKKYTYGIDYFLKEQKLAMFPYWLTPTTARLPQLKETGKDFNWDVVSFPSLEEKPGIGREVDFHLATVTPNSPNKKAAYAVLKTMVSEEAQRAMNKGTRLTVLTDPALKKEVSMETKLYEGKNLQGIFKVKPGPLPKSNKLDLKVYPFLNEAAKNMAYEGKDVNTVLREAEEKANKWIQENK